MAKRATNLTTGDHLVDVTCPDCRQVETIAVSLSPVLTVTQDSSSLKVKLSQEKADHDCRQGRLDQAPEDQGDLFAEPELDAAE